MPSDAFPLETLVTGRGLIEGPRVDDRNRLYFSDVPNGGVYRRDPSGKTETVIPKRRGVGGIALHADGGVVVSGRNICHVRGGATRILFDLEDTPGFNDLFVDSEGRVLVGSMRSNPFDMEAPRVLGECYRIEAEGKATQLYDGISLTNGIGFSPDGRTLYHSDTAPNQVLAHDMDPAGACSGRRVFATLPRGRPDGLAVDEAGCVWVAAYGGNCVTRFTPEGDVDLHLEVPARQVTSVCFGGPDRRALYIATADNTEDPARGGTIFRTRAPVAGLAVPLVRV
ncbi:MAG: SMP-30/gluconolactonase/LRE family protein [Proteobacteria bacterium]|nr:SMP-30/gluconolactonase/LRE family protein [Pseudomonadota bacterium]